MSVPCKHCDSLAHTSFYCYQKPRKPIKRTRVKKIGKIGEKWKLTRIAWFELYPPNTMGMYECYLKIHPNCPRFMTPQQTTLDHIESRTRHPELRFCMDNLGPACWWCNEMKKSRSLDEIDEYQIHKTEDL